MFKAVEEAKNENEKGRMIVLSSPEKIKFFPGKNDERWTLTCIDFSFLAQG